LGEKCSSLDSLLDKLAQWHERQTLALSDTLAQTLEPLLMLVVGGIVGALVIAMYLPIFQLGKILELADEDNGAPANCARCRDLV